MAGANQEDSYFTPRFLDEELYNHLVLPQKLPHREDARRRTTLEAALITRLITSAKFLAEVASSTTSASPNDDGDSA